MRSKSPGAVGVFRDEPLMTPKGDYNKNVAHWREAAEYVTDVLTPFWSLLWSTTVQTNGNMESICFVWWQSKIL